MKFKKLKGQTALITGAAKRLGRSIAGSLASRGVNIVVHYNHSSAEADTLADNITSYGVKAWTVQADLADEKAVDDLFCRSVQLSGGMDILINNASIFPASSLLEFSSIDLFTNIKVNSLAPHLLAKKFYQQQRPGNIINLLDTKILDYDKNHVAYHLSKRMLYTLTMMTAMEFAPRVRVNGVAPGVILAPEGTDESYLEKMKNTNPMNNIGKVEDITGAVEFLLVSDFITGQVIYVDGGRHLKGVFYGK